MLLCHQVVVGKENCEKKDSNNKASVADGHQHQTQTANRRGYMKQIMDCSVLNNGVFCLFVVGHSIYALGSSGYNAHLPSWAVASGYTLEQGAALVASTSFGVLVGRLPFALIANASFINFTLMAGLLACLAGVASLAVPLVMYYGPAVGMCIFHGLLQCKSVFPMFVLL